MDYQYQPLDQATHEIRLIELLAGRGDEPVQCTLSHVPLTAAPPFNALSYTWGDAKDTVTITVDDTLSHVTRNLQLALLHIRKADKATTWWADALCINQQDAVEKSWQVQRMREVYSTADEVVAFLGPEGDDSNFAIDLLNTMNGPGLDQFQDAINSRGDSDALMELRPYKSIRRLLERPYWSRVWVVQELAVAAREPILLCGQKRSTLEILGTACIRVMELAVRHEMEPDLFGTRLELAGELQVLRSTVVGSTPDNDCAVMQWLQWTSGFDASESRDHIYALIGLGRGQHQNVFCVDYRKPVEQVFVDAMHYAIETDRCLDIVSFVSYTPSTLNLPSWVPDFTSRDPLMRCNKMVFWGYKASGDTSMEVTWPRYGVLQAAGIPVDSVAAVHLPWLYDEPLQAMENFALTTLYGTSVERNDTSIHDTGAFWRTMIGNRDMTGDRPPTGAFAEELSSGCYIALQHLSKLPNERLLEVQKTFENDDTDGRDRLTKPFDDNFSTMFGWSGGTKRCFFVTHSGRLGVGPITTQAGDEITILYGGKVPFLLRHDVAGAYRAVGEGYVHGIMEGEALDLNYEKQYFRII